jgi:2-oxoacid:acceptor oxidoreductase delta subunit (pyruvate/2-ketoisovalerate family)
MPAVSDEIEEAVLEGVRLQFLAAPVSIQRVKDGVEVTFTRMKLGAPDASGRPRPVPIPDTEFCERADLVLTAVGERADLQFIDPEQRSVLLGVVSSDTNEGVAGLFLGGDAQTGPATVVEAIAAGRRAAAEIWAYLQKKHPILDSPIKSESDVVGFERINSAYFSRQPRLEGEHLPVFLRIDNFKEVVEGLSLSEAVSEACRCFSCGTCTQCDNCWVFCPEGAVTRDEEGTYQVDLNYCKGCGICVEECPRGIISLIQEEQ